MPDYDVVTKERLTLGECPIWSEAEGALYYIDILGPALFRQEASGGCTRWDMPSSIGSFALTEDGRALVALRDGLYMLDLSSKALTSQASVAHDTASMRFNDGRCDRSGRFWVGSMVEPRTSAEGRLYSFTPNEGLREKESGVVVSNGLAFSPDDKILYYADSNKRTVWAYDFEIASGEVSNRRVFIETPEKIGRSDGAAVDADGCYWGALIGHVGRFTPDGKLDKLIEMPFSRVTMCAFGGPGLDTLFVTSASNRLTEAEMAAQPLAGHILALKPGVAGLAEPRYRAG